MVYQCPSLEFLLCCLPLPLLCVAGITPDICIHRLYVNVSKCLLLGLSLVRLITTPASNLLQLDPCRRKTSRGIKEDTVEIPAMPCISFSWFASLRRPRPGQPVSNSPLLRDIGHGHLQFLFHSQFRTEKCPLISNPWRACGICMPFPCPDTKQVN